MRYDIDGALQQIEQRSDTIKKKKKAQAVAVLSAVSTAMCVMLTIAITMFAGAAPSGMVSPQYGSLMLNEAAGGYVLTAVISFVSSSVITCAAVMRRRK